ncbi:hypothetical protein DPMN_075242 [Dreissena polymorpha]|uniref:Uncharacterized protein n=1 Tax=Dreissena polymorpha TaxID=45954 RepID=A0A9D3YK12_DREPO|nr:hypothetical protein DPMN_075242 [Dreissena polymorpha]
MVQGAGRKLTRLFGVVGRPNPAPLRHRGHVLNALSIALTSLRLPGPAAKLVHLSHVFQTLGAKCSGCGSGGRL